MPTPNAGIPWVPEGTLDPAAGLNESLRVIDALIQPLVLGVGDTVPPVSPSDGDRYIVGPGATGDWVGQDDNMAQYVEEGDFWQFYIAGQNVVVVVYDGSIYAYAGSSGWVPVAGGGSGDVVGPASSAADRIALFDGTTGKLLKQAGKTFNESRIQSFVIACSDETTAITAGTAKVKFRMPYPFTVTEVRASLTVAQSAGSIFTVDINEAGASILSTKITIDNTETTSTTAATPPVISDTSLTDDAEISVDVDQIGTSGATGLKVTIIGYPT